MDELRLTFFSGASFFLNGGTVFETWMEKALDLVDESQFEKAERGMRAYGALIGSNQGEAPLDQISDAVIRLDDLRGDLPALEVIFSTV